MAKSQPLQANSKVRGLYYPNYPVLGLASNGNDIFAVAGGGGSTAAKEVPNWIQAFRYDESTCQPSLVAELNTGKQVIVHLTYSQATGQFLASSQSGCKVMVLDEGSGTFNEICQWNSEFEQTGTSRKPLPPEQNVAKYSPKGDIIATGGTDGIVRIFGPASAGVEPALIHTLTKNKEVKDVDFGPNSGTLASVDDTGCCRLWDTSTGTEKACIQYAVPGSRSPSDVRCMSFAPSPSGDVLVLGAHGGGRTPGCVALFTLDGKKLMDVQVDKEFPMTCMSVDPKGLYACVCMQLKDMDVKKIYSLPNLKCVGTKKKIHELPAPCCTFVCSSTAISGSADKCIDCFTLNAPGGSGGQVSLVYLVATVLAVIFLAYLLVHLGVRSAGLGQSGRLEF